MSLAKEVGSDGAEGKQGKKVTQISTRSIGPGKREKAGSVSRERRGKLAS